MSLNIFKRSSIKRDSESNIKLEKKKFFKGKRKVIIPLVIIGIIGTSIFIYANSNKENLVQVSTVALEKGTIEQILPVTGKIQGTDNAEISSSLNYEIIQINVKEGDYVEQGQVLAVLDDKDLKQEINLARKDVELAMLQYKETIDASSNVDKSTESAEIQVKQSQMDVEESKRQYDIKKSLFESGAIPKEELAQSEINMQKSEIALILAKDNLRKLKIEIEKTIKNSSPKASDKKMLEIKQEQLAQKEQDIEKIYIKSPISGTITRVNARLGRSAQLSVDNKPLFVVENLNDLRMKVDISEFDIGNISEGLTAKITADVLNEDSLEAIVLNISPTGEIKEGASSREMVIPVELDILSEDSRLIAGVTAQAKILLNKKDNVFKVPFDALLEEDESYIFIEKDGILKKVKVEIGLESDTEVEIISNDVMEKDKVVLTPDASYTEGMKVELKGEDDETQPK